MANPLNDDQLLAAASRRPRTLIEAGPGAGKTTIAAERFGLLRFSRTTAQNPPVVALSFTNAATGVLRKAIEERWGRTALGQRGVVRTIDSDLVRTLEFLLRSGHLTWPSANTSLNPLESWDARPEYKFRPKDLRWQPFFVVGVNERSVTAVSTTDKSASVS